MICTLVTSTLPKASILKYSINVCAIQYTVFLIQVHIIYIINIIFFQYTRSAYINMNKSYVFFIFTIITLMIVSHSFTAYADYTVSKKYPKSSPEKSLKKHTAKTILSPHYNKKIQFQGKHVAINDSLNSKIQSQKISKIDKWAKYFGSI